VLIHKLKALIRVWLAPLIYRYAPLSLAPERLYLFLHYLIDREDVPGAVVEIGCNLGGTTSIAFRMLKRINSSKSYSCIDTFEGFVNSQFSHDAQLGTPLKDRHLFAGNSRRLVKKVLSQHGCADVQLIQGDIIKLKDDMLPGSCSVVLIDVDLVEPTYAALNKFWPRLSPGGIILVDDCLETSSWKAKVAYVKFCKVHNLPEHYKFGMGLIEKQRLYSSNE
jgi:hypothetical protein